MSEKSNIALDYALAGGVPLALYSANKVYKGIEDGNSNVVILNIPGLSHDVGDIDLAIDTSDTSESIELGAASKEAFVSSTSWGGGLV